MSASHATKRYQIPRATLNDRVSDMKNNKEISIEPDMGFHNTFSPEHEEILAALGKDLTNRPMPLIK